MPLNSDDAGFHSALALVREPLEFAIEHFAHHASKAWLACPVAVLAALFPTTSRMTARIAHCTASRIPAFRTEELAPMIRHISIAGAAGIGRPPHRRAARSRTFQSLEPAA